MEILQCKIRKANKEHKCDFCDSIIKIGEKYDWQKCKFNGILYEWKAHTSCCQLASKLKMYDWMDEGLTGEDFKEIIKETYFNWTPQTNEKETPNFAEMLEIVKQNYNVL